MKKFLLITLITFLLGNLAFSQQLPMYSQYMNNKFLLNPAIAGSEDYIPIRLTARQQWVGISDAPSTQALSGNFLLGNKNMGLGGYIFNDSFGIEGKTGVQISYSYILDLGFWDSKLGIGLSVMGFQYRFNTEGVQVTDENDPTIAYSKESAFVPDASFGLYWHNDKFFFGASANQLIEFKVNFEGIDGKELDASDNTLQRHYFIMGGYKFKLSKEFDIEPSTMLKFTEGSAPLNVDLNVKGYYKKNYWLGVSYRSGIPFDTGNSIVAMIGATYKHIVIGYAFDYMFSNINSYTSGTHEIMIGYNFGETVKKGSSLL
jgi:type IX secretion system PorP/SprF family membrane protein